MARNDIIPGFIILIFGCIGLLLGAIEYILYQDGIGATALTTAGLDITSLIVITVFLSTLLGCIVAAVR